MAKFFTALSGLFLVMVLPPVFAASTPEPETVTWYDVELIVFRNLDTRSTETWPVEAGVPDVEQARPLFPPPALETAEPGAQPGAGTATLPVDTTGLAAAPEPYQPLDPAAYQLNGIYGSLQRSSRYEPLLHVAWTQPPLEREQAPYIRVTLPETIPSPAAPESGMQEDTNEPLLGSQDDEDSGSVPSAAAGELPEFLAPEQGPRLARPLDGRVQLSVSRYLHLDLDLLYLPDDVNTAVLHGAAVATREWTEAEKRERDERKRQLIDALARGDISLEEAEILALEPEEQVFQGFRFNQFRRLRSRELHYFDHPVFGAIVMVTPREVPVAKPATTERP